MRPQVRKLLFRQFKRKILRETLCIPADLFTTVGRTAIECHLEGLLLDGDEIPPAQSVETHLKNRDYAGGTWALVSVDLSRLASKAKRINITLPERVLALVDEQARREGETRSGLLARAALDYIGRHKVA